MVPRLKNLQLVNDRREGSRAAADNMGAIPMKGQGSGMFYAHGV